VKARGNITLAGPASGRPACVCSRSFPLWDAELLPINLSCPDCMAHGSLPNTSGRAMTPWDGSARIWH